MKTLFYGLYRSGQTTGKQYKEHKNERERVTGRAVEACGREPEQGCGC